MNADVVLLATGGSNFTSLQAAIERLGARCRQSHDPEQIRAATHVVLPGVGSAGAAMQAITAQNLAPLIRSLSQPVLGICLGMQILFSHSEESDVDTLGLIPGRVRRLPNADGIRIPHMGWNAINAVRDDALLAGVTGQDFYFVHTYAADDSEATLARCTHGQAFPAVVRSGNVYGVQFHPERSGPQGSRLLANFLGITA
ncbi:imidazole glycerol phosphate synthase subunit HisH [Arenimonas sp. GDDSR-1]|uniref:imidazole glycerol phosphate synthase subunit HisH n=1 Tax=Arenimonas sp. GDDSR-1 TaxID=2950125 RepID=UPI00261AFF55|nr:imidazole glycerol phosphate synthase subunit HisH [Arenimonas sp. GDDSR-1]